MKPLPPLHATFRPLGPLAVHLIPARDLNVVWSFRGYAVFVRCLATSLHRGLALLPSIGLNAILISLEARRA
jgi:hypothetical protein